MSVGRGLWSSTGRGGKLYDDVREQSLAFSPNSKRIGYVARERRNEFVVVDGQEGKLYDDVREQSLAFSPDSKRIGYVARERRNEFVVVDGQEGCQYDQIVPPPEGRSVLFDSPDQLHYIGRKGNAFHLVEEQLG